MNTRAGSATLLWRWVPPLALLALLLLGWELTVRLGEIAPWLLPPPSAIPAAIIADAGDLLRHTLVTLQEVLLGLVVSTLLGIVTAVAIAFFPLLERALYPLVVASQSVPLPVLAPLLIIFLGYGIVPKILLVTLICFFPIVVNTVDGLHSVDRDAVNLLRTFGATRWQIFVKVRWPSALPLFFSGLRVAAAVSVIGAVFGELIGASAGLGYYIRHETPLFHTAAVYGATIILMLLGIALFVVVRAAEWVLLPWRRRLAERSRV
ncbi:MAG TPA: ABC transporter permease [Thermomicrobiales bacterium]|jgi:ABC-type nitrate/sulfonate/bicarbonate transport system permease component